MAWFLFRRANADLEEIRDFTIESWGETRWIDYYLGLVATFQRVADDPKQGRARDEFAIALRSIIFRSHIVFYVPLTGGDWGLCGFCTKGKMPRRWIGVNGKCRVGFMSPFQ